MKTSCDHEPKHGKGMCMKCYTAAHYQANRDSIRARQKKRHASLSPEQRERRRAQQKSCRAALSPERRKEHRRRQKEQDARYLAKNEEKVRARRKAYLKANPDKALAQWQRRRAWKRGCTEHFTREQWKTLKRQLGNRCVGCWRTEKQLNAVGLVLAPDHIIPLSKGGLDDITNIQPLCNSRKAGAKGSCNQKKNAKYHDFLVS